MNICSDCSLRNGKLAARRSSRQVERAALQEKDIQKAEREYSLNLTKTLKKKAEQCTLDTKYMHSWRMRIEFSKCLVESMKYEDILWYLTMNQSKVMRDRPFNIKSIKDNRGMTNETQIKVSQKKGEKSGPHKYTVNLYHARSSMMVNDRRVAMFTHAHKAAESQIMNI